MSKEALKIQQNITRNKLKGELIEHASAHKNRQNEAVQYFKKFIKKDERVLDCGCRDGGQMLVWAEHGYTNFVGIECTREAYEVALSKNLNVYHGDIHELPFENEQFDVVFLSHVFEHLYDPMKALSECKRVTKYPHKIMIELPIETEAIKEAGHYISFKTKEDFLNYMNENGYTVNDDYYYKQGPKKGTFRGIFYEIS